MSMKIKKGWMVALLGVVLLSHGCGVRCCNDDTIGGVFPPGIYLNFPSGIYQLVNQSFTLADTFELKVPLQYELMNNHSFKVVGDKAYWVEASNTLYRADLDGGNREVILSGGIKEEIFSFDVGDTYIFYNRNGDLYRAALDGSNPILFEEILFFGAGLPVIDRENNKVCWSRTGIALCSGTDSSDTETLFMHGSIFNSSVFAFYSEESKMYWVSTGGNTDLFEFDMITSVNSVVDTFSAGPRNLKIEDGFLYWYEGGNIVRSPLTSLDLGSPEVFISGASNQYFDVHVETAQVFHFKLSYRICRHRCTPICYV